MKKNNNATINAIKYTGKNDDKIIEFCKKISVKKNWPDIIYDIIVNKKTNIIKVILYRADIILQKNDYIIEGLPHEVMIYPLSTKDFKLKYKLNERSHAI